jgi:regulator of sigma E protease
VNSFLMSVLALIIVLGVLVFVHEAGHFIAAKLSGIYVHRFSLGLGAPVKALTWKRGETEYAVSWLPLGGYVKMASREEEVTTSALEGGKATAPVPPDRMFEAKPVWKRMIVILAGVTMNALFAWLLFTILAIAKGVPTVPTTRIGLVDTTALTPASQNLKRLAPGDRVTAVNGVPVNSWNDVVDGITQARGAALILSIEGKGDVSFPVSSDALEDRVAIGRALLHYQQAVVGLVVAGSPAAKAGIRRGDTVLAVAGTPVVQWFDMVNGIQANPGKEIAMELGTRNGRRAIAVTPRSVEVKDAQGTRTVGQVGINMLEDVEYRQFSLGGAIGQGLQETIGYSTLILRSVKGMIRGLISPRALGGPVAIGKMAGESLQLGWADFLFFMAIISVNLAVLNLLPIPVLDGGQFLFLLAEAVIRRPLSLRLRERLTAVGLVAILLLMVFAFSNDILKLFGI